MITELNNSIGVFVPKMEAEGYLIAFQDRGLEDYLYGIIIMDNGEFWVLPQTDFRATVNYSASRNKINKSLVSEYINKLKENGTKES